MLNIDTIDEITSVPKFDVVISQENAKSDIIQLLKFIRPKWDHDSVLFEKMKGGVINTMYKCYVDDENERDIVVRVYFKPDDEKLYEAFDRTKEVRNFEKLRHSGIAPELLAVFRNGICYEYLHGDVLTCSLVRTEKLIPYVTKLLARVHSLPSVNWSTPWSFDEHENMVAYPPNLKDPERLKTYLKFLPTKDHLHEESTHCKSYFKNLRSPLVYCHNDTKGENFIWNESRSELKLIDLEHSGMSFQAYEIGAHFVSYTDITDPKPGCYPSREFQLNWIRAYLTAYYKTNGRKPEDITDKDVETLFVESNKLAQASRFFIATGCIALVEHGMFDCFDFCMIHLAEYFENKEKVDALTLLD